MSTALWYRIKDWLEGRPSLSLEELNKLLEKEVTAREVRAELLEKEAGLRKRLESAELRCREAKRSTNPRGTLLYWVLGAIVVTLILFAMFKGC